VNNEDEDLRASVPESFRTARLRAERIGPQHLPDLVRFHQNPQVMAELGGVRSEEQTSLYLSRNAKHWEEYGFGVWMLQELEVDGVVGRVILRHLLVGDVDEVEIGFALLPRLWSRGLAAEAAASCLGFARQELDLASVVGVTTLTNRASQRTLSKLGFVHESAVTIDGTPCALYRVRWEVDRRAM
jgi:ribosomal-protein-alanine N-acetyltransferase